MKSEWMPENKYAPLISEPRRMIKGTAKAYAEGCHDTAVKLLTYLKERLHDGDWISATAINQMLKEIEEAGK